jgi:predicted nuclease of predicted toxin-antitoxin system
VTFLFDENLSPRQAARLRARGYDAVAVVEIGCSGASDPIIRSNAIAMNRILVTLDADFGNILRYPVVGTPGVIWLRLHPPTEKAISEALDRVIDKLGAQGLEEKLIVVDEDKIRIRGSHPT